jgi:hypothetical protein
MPYGSSAIPWHFAMRGHTLPYRIYIRGQFQKDPYARNALVLISVRQGSISVHHVHNPSHAMPDLEFPNSFRTIYRIRLYQMPFLLKHMMFKIYM